MASGAHRHADIILAGLRADPTAAPLGGPALTLGDLQQLRQTPDDVATGTP